MSAFIGAGIARGAEAVQEYDRNYEQRQLQRQNAKQQQQLSAQKLKEYTENAPMRQSKAELEVQQLKLQTDQLNASALERNTYSAFDKYYADGDVKHMNTLLRDAKNNPRGVRQFGEVSRYDKLVKNPETDTMLRKAGFADPSVVYDDPELSKTYLVGTKTNGEQFLFNVDDVAAGTRYTQYATNRDLEQEAYRARIKQMARSGQSRSAITLKERVAKSLIESGKATDLAEAYEMVEAMDSGKGKSSDERLINEIAEDKDISTLEAMEVFYGMKNQSKGQTDQSRYVESYLANNPEATEADAVAKYKNLTKTTKQKEQSSMDEARTVLDDMNFFDTTYAEMDPKDQHAAYREVERIQRMGNLELSNEDKRVLRNVRDLVGLGGTVADKMTPAETGLLDKFTGEMKSYLVDEVGGKEATSAYETFRNVFRNSLYGASLTDSEIKAFESAAGSRSKKYKPAMVAMKTQMTSLKNKLESIRDLNDPYVAHYYIGGSVEDVDRVIEAFEQRIGAIDGVLADTNKGEGSIVKKLNPAEQVEVQSKVTPDGTPPKRSMTEIWRAISDEG